MVTKLILILLGLGGTGLLALYLTIVAALGGLDRLTRRRRR